MTAKLRIALGGIHIEASTFAPYSSGENDFTLRRGDALLQRYPWVADSTLAGDLDPGCQTDPDIQAMFSNVEWIPLVHARALPGGSVNPKFYAAWWDEFFGLLQDAVDRAPIDGLLLDIHGALATEGHLDPEGDIAAHARQIVGQKTVISASMDLHGNVSDQLFNACTLLTCYRTAPHIDAPETRYRAAVLMVQYLNHPIPLFRAKVDVPILLPGEKTSTKVEPGKSLYELIPGTLQKDKVWDCAIWMGFPWADQPRCHGAVVVSGPDLEQVKHTATELGQAYWDRADQFEFVGPVASPIDAIRQGLNSAQKPYFVSDTGDNPGAGGADDRNDIVRILLDEYTQAASTKTVVVASLYDPETVEVATKLQPGDQFQARIGAKLGKEPNPIEILVVIKRFFESSIGGSSVVLSPVDTPALDIIVTAQRCQYGSEKAFATAGYPHWENVDLVIVKIGYLEPDLAEAAGGWVMALTPGAVDQDLERMGHKLLTRPLVPFQTSDFAPDLEPKLAGHNL